MRKKEAAAEYDLATWRMYNRIVDHREKHPVKYELKEEKKEAGTFAAKRIHDRASETTDRFNSSRTESLDSFHSTELYDEYGVVFQLDL